MKINPNHLLSSRFKTHNESNKTCTSCTQQLPTQEDTPLSITSQYGWTTHVDVDDVFDNDVKRLRTSTKGREQKWSDAETHETVGSNERDEYGNTYQVIKKELPRTKVGTDYIYDTRRKPRMVQWDLGCERKRKMCLLDSIFILNFNSETKRNGRHMDTRIDRGRTSPLKVWERSSGEGPIVTKTIALSRLSLQDKSHGTWSGSLYLTY